MKTYYGSDNTEYYCEQQLGTGSESTLYSIKGNTHIIAKIIKKERLPLEKQEKLKALASIDFSDNLRKQMIIPQAVLYSDRARTNLVGYVMEKLDSRLANIASVCSKDSRTELSQSQKTDIAMNLCIVLNQAHIAGFVLCDFNFKNIMVNLSNGYVKLTGTENYAFNCVTSDGREMQFPCTSVNINMAAPEISAGFPLASDSADRFGMAVYIFMLLMNGYSPLDNSGEYIFCNGKTVNVPDDMHDINSLTLELRQLFKHVFCDYKDLPLLRPDEKAFYNALRNYQDILLASE